MSYGVVQCSTMVRAMSPIVWRGVTPDAADLCPVGDRAFCHRTDAGVTRPLSTPASPHYPPSLAGVPVHWQNGSETAAFSLRHFFPRLCAVLFLGLAYLHARATYQPAWKVVVLVLMWYLSGLVCTYFKDISPDIFSDSLVSVVLLAVSYLFPVVDSVPDCLVQRVLKPAPALGVSMFTYA